MSVIEHGQQQFTALADRIRDHAEAFPEKRAIVCNEDALTYRAWVDRAMACAGRFQALDFPAGGERRVGILSANSLDYLIVTLACQLAGITVVPLPGLIVADALGRMLQDANVGIIFHDSAHILLATDATGLVMTEIVLVEIGQTAAGGRDLLGEWSAGSPQFQRVEIHPDWPSDFIYSSGTTGIPKGIVQSYAARAAQCQSLNAIGVDDGTCLLNTVGLYSNFGMAGFMLASWWGGTFFMMRKFSAEMSVQYLAHDGVNVAWVAPATLIRIIEAPGFDDAVEGRPCLKLCAGAPLSAAHKQQVLNEWAGRIL